MTLPRLLVATVAAGSVSLLIGCGAASPEAGEAAGPWKAELDAAASQATSDFERAVFSDGVISPEEYRESLDRYVTCLSDAGFAISLDEDEGIFGYVLVGAEADASFDQASGACKAGNNLLIEPVYVDSYLNPEHANFSDLIAACLVENEKVEAPFSGQDVSEAFDKEYSQGLPWSTSDPVALRCLDRPVR